MSKLRVGVIGAGGWTRTCHIPYLQADGRAEVVALCGRTASRLQSQADEFDIPKTYTDFRQLLLDPEIDAVTIATSNNVHADIAITALHAGKHVFCEKPLAMNQKESYAMWQTAKESGLVNQVAFTFRHLYGANLARKMIMEGAIGEIIRVEGYSEGHSGLNPDYPWNWRDSQELSGTGRLADMGSHVYDLAYFLTELQVESVAGHMSTLIKERPLNGEKRPVTTDDAAEFIAQFSSGAEGYFSISRIKPGEGRSYVQVTGENGALRVRYSRGNIDTVTQSGPLGQAFQPVLLPDGCTPQANHALAKMMSAFVAACLGDKGQGHAATFADGHRTQQVLDSVHRASLQREWVMVKDGAEGYSSDLQNE